MSVNTLKTVREWAVENSTAPRIFEKLGIDYCCGGGKSLEEACSAANLSVEQVLDSLELAEQEAKATREDRNGRASHWANWSPTSLGRTTNTPGTRSRGSARSLTK